MTTKLYPGDPDLDTINAMLLTIASLAYRAGESVPKVGIMTDTPAAALAGDLADIEDRFSSLAMLAEHAANTLSRVRASETKGAIVPELEARP